MSLPLLLCNKTLEKLKYEMHYRRNLYDHLGDIITYEHVGEPGDFFEIMIWLNSNKILSLVFDLDGYIIGIELRERERKNSISLLKRNYNGVCYIFPKNCLNLEKETINYYLDYYNNNVIINDSYARKLIDEVYQIVKSLKTEIGICDSQKFLEKIFKHNPQDLFDKNFYRRQGYKTQLSVLPPNVRPDNNSDYTIIQIVCGCKIMARRGKACGFCSSYDMKYHEYSINELDEHIKCLKTSNPHITQNAKCVFLSDGDPLSSAMILQQMDFINKRLPNIISFESFVSTGTILNMEKVKWKRLLNRGIRKVYWGVESADNITLNLIDKPHNEEMLYRAKLILEENSIPYDMIIMCGIGNIDKEYRTIEELTENDHVKKTVKFINESACESVFISKLQITPNSTLGHLEGKSIFAFSEEEMELQYRSLISKINKSVRGSYGNQFVVERAEDYEI